MSKKDIHLTKDLAERALELSNRIEYEKGSEDALYALATYEATIENYYKSLDLLYEYLELVRERGEPSLEEIVCVRIAMLYMEIENYNASLIYCNTAVKLAGQTRKSYDLALANQCLSHYYYQIKDIPKAIKSADTAYKYSLLTGDIEIKARIEKLLGDLNIERKMLTNAINYYQKALKDFRSLKNMTEIAIVLTRIAHVYQLRKNFTEVLNYSKQAYKIRLSQNNKEFISHAQVNLGNAFLDIGDKDSAFHFYQLGFLTARQSKNLTAQVYAHKQLYKFYKNKRDYPQALKYFEQYTEVYNQVRMEKHSSKLNSLELRNLEKEKEAQISILQKENEIQQLSLKTRSYSELITQLIIGIIGVLLIITVYIIERNKLGKSKLERINEQLNQEIGERKLTEIQLRDSEGKYRFITEHTLDLIVRMDRNFNYLFVSPSILRMFGYSAEDKINLPPLNELIPDKFKDKLKTKYLEMIRTKEPMMLTHQSEHKNGSLFWSESFVNPIFDGNTGKLKETITVIRNVTDRIVYEEALSGNAKQKELLLREIHHRVKNNFAILVSLMNMQKVSTEPGNFKDFLTELQGRIRTMSLVHELLYRSHDLDCINFGEYLSQLVGVISRAYKNKHVEIHSTFDNCILDVETALPLGLISNEIITNAYKYAFTDLPEGELWVELRKYPVENHEKGLYTHTLTIRDNGPGIPGGFSVENQSTMGSQIISLLTEQLEAKLNCSGENGTSFTICFSGEKRL